MNLLYRIVYGNLIISVYKEREYFKLNIETKNVLLFSLYFNDIKGAENYISKVVNKQIKIKEI